MNFKSNLFIKIDHKVIRYCTKIKPFSKDIYGSNKDVKRSYDVDIHNVC